MDREDIKVLVAKWWDIYNDESLDYPISDLVPEGEIFTKLSIMSTMPEPAITYAAPTAA